MFFLIGCGLLYFLPSIVAHRKHAFTGVFLVNLASGLDGDWMVRCADLGLHRRAMPRFYAVRAFAGSAPRQDLRPLLLALRRPISHGVGSFCWNCGARV